MLHGELNQKNFESFVKKHNKKTITVLDLINVGIPYGDAQRILRENGYIETSKDVYQKDVAL
jgi:FMN-dependent NADH-azoreductase